MVMYREVSISYSVIYDLFSISFDYWKGIFEKKERRNDSPILKPNFNLSKQSESVEREKRNGAKELPFGQN